jgi:hypothetical protein
MKYILLFFLLHPAAIIAQQPAADTFYLLQPDRVFDGEQMHEGWQVLVKNSRIEAAEL